MQKIQYFAYFNKSGYAQSGLDYILALKRYFDIKVTPFGGIDQCSLSPNTLKEIYSMIKKPDYSDSVNIYHCIPTMQNSINSKGKDVGFGVFETFDPPKDWVEVLNENEAVICPSEFCKKIFEQGGVNKPIFHIPHCVDFDLYNKVQKQKNERFTFLYFGTWRKRKGWNLLLEAWMKTFDKNDNVQLIIKTDRFTLANQSIEQMRKELGFERKEIAPIVFECKTLNELELAQFYSKIDCLVNPSLGEGFYLSGIQAMATKTPVLTTVLGGSSDWANEETVTMINHDGYVIYNDLDKIPQFANKKWGHITEIEISNKLRWVVDNYNQVLEKTKKAYEYVFEKFNYNITVKRFENLINSIHE